MSRPLTRAELLTLLCHFAGSPYRDRLEQIAAHDEAQRRIIGEQARRIAHLFAPGSLLISDEDECPCCLTHSCEAFRAYAARTLRPVWDRDAAPSQAYLDETEEASRLHLGTGAGLACRMAMPGGEK